MSSGFSRLEQQQRLHRGPRSQAEEGTDRKKQAQEWKAAITTLLCRPSVRFSQKSPQPSSHSWPGPCFWTAEMFLVDPVIGSTGLILGYLHETGVVQTGLIIRMVNGG